MSILNPSNPDDSLIEDIVSIGAISSAPATLGYLNNKYSNSKFQQKVDKFGTKIAGSDYLNNQMGRSTSLTTGQVLSTTNQGLQKSVLSVLMALEEASPLHILRTLQLSNFIQPYTELSKNSEIIHLAASHVRNQQHYYNALVKYANDSENIKIKRELGVRDLTRGLFFHQNKLYGAGNDGKINLDDVVVRNARLSLSTLKNGDITSSNRILEKYANIIGGQINKEAAKADPLLVVAGKSNMGFHRDWAKSTLRFSMDVGFKTFDNPIAGIEEMLQGVGAGHTGMLESKAWNFAKDRLNIGFGTGGIYNLSIRESLKISAKNLAVKGTGLYLGYQGIDSLLRTISPENGIFNQGLGAGLTNIYASTRIGIAEVWSDKFQGYKNKQEQAAPGSTDLSKLLAFPLAGALAGAQLAYLGRVGTSVAKGTEAASKVFNVETESRFLRSVGVDSALKPMKKNALIGGLIGGAFALPFLPGALIGSSSQELRDLYSGKTEVAEKANKFWMMGGTAWEGSNTKYFTQSWVARVRADATDKVRYGDDDTKKKMNPFLHPFSYLRDPYKFEKRNAESMPYPVWGMDVSFGGFFGKAFEKTIGAVIKPDKINPAVYDAMRQNSGVIGPDYQSPDSESIGTLAGEALAIRHEAGAGLVSAISSFFSSGDGNKLQGISNKDESLINAGLMTAPVLPSYQPHREASAASYRALTDFTGIKGWTSSLAISASGFDPADVSMQMARSGEASSAARDLVEQNLGDMLGCFTPEMRVKTIDGYKEIQYVEVGDLVLSRGGVYRPVKEVFKKEFDNIEILNISTESSQFALRCTPDHKMNRIQIKEYPYKLTSPFKNQLIKDTASTLNIGDMLLIPTVRTNSNILYKGGVIDCNQYVKVTRIDSERYSGFVYDLEIDANELDNEFTIKDINFYVVNSIEVSNSGEFQRKILPTSSGALAERFNPIANNAASWLPQDKAKYFTDFKHGNMYDKVDRGEERLPGVGLAALNPELQGIDPENYPLIYKYKILTDVARGSREYVQARLQVLNEYKAGNLSKRETEILGTTLEQEKELQQKKTFYEAPTGLRGPVGLLQGSLWEVMRTSSESPLEMLTPIRPAAKFLHQRTAIEDYIETQLGGPDAAIWTNPYSHFIKPALNKSRQSLSAPSNAFIPQEAREKGNIDEYFDKLDYIRKRMNGSDSQALSTVVSSSLSGLNTKEKVLKFKASLQDNQKDYFESFSKEVNPNKRAMIRSMLPEDVRRGYEQIWHNVDVANSARKNGVSVQKALAEDLHGQTSRLSDTFGVSLTNKEEEKARAKVKSNTDSYYDSNLSVGDRIKYTEDELLRLKMADREALTYVKKTTGLPNSKYLGWDPRLNTDDIKIRTLSIGGEDLKRFGFWKQDEVRMNQLTPYTDETSEIFSQIDAIKSGIKSERSVKSAIERTMFQNGFKATKINMVDSNYGSLLVRENES